MNQKLPVTYSADAEQLGWIVLDDPESRANVLNDATQAALEAAISAAAADDIKALVVISAKERIFVAGADLNALAALVDATAATEFSRKGQRLFQRLAEFPVPVVCAIHGACAGGGLELALACHWRIASDAAVTQIGLPETSIGTIPGWGGSVRLPRLIGAKAALEHILQGQLISGAEAMRVGFVHEVVSNEQLRTRAKSAALKLAVEGHPPVALFPPAAMCDWFRERRESVSGKPRGQQPALLAAIDAVERTSPRPIGEAFEVEARIFGEVTVAPTCKSLIRVFFLREAAKKRTLAGWFEGAEAQVRSSTPSPLRRIGVVGAGVMGSGIAHWLAARGFEVVLRDVQAEFLARGMDVVRGLFDEAVKRGKQATDDAASARQRIATTTGWDGFDTCDLVIEAIVENVSAKQALFSEVAAVVRSDTLLASNTSALPIEEIAGHVMNPQRTLGIHFFNPVSRMPLVELVLGAHTSEVTASRSLALVKALGKSPVICRSSPGFLVTRVLFFYLNEAVRMWEGGTPTVVLDSALRDFGWPMGPLRLIDEVGIDVADFIFGEMEHYFPKRFVRSTACDRLLAAGLKGRKNGASHGFYRYEGEKSSANDSETRALAGAESKPPQGRKARAGDDITAFLMRIMVEEAERCVAEGVVKSADDVDFALLSGAGFPAFRGGLLHWARGRSPFAPL